MEHSSREMASLGGEHRLTEPELMSLGIALQAEMLGLKKCLHYAEESSDEQAKHLFHEHADIHHRRIDMMLDLLGAEGDITKAAKLMLQSGQPQGGTLHA